MKFPIYILAVNKPTFKNILAEFYIFFFGVASLVLYVFVFKHHFSPRAYAAVFVSGGLIGGMFEYFSEKYYDYDNPLFSWFEKKDFSGTFMVAYGGMVSIIHFLSLIIIKKYNLPSYIGFFFPSAILSMLILGGADSIVYNIIKYYKYDKSFFDEIPSMFKIVKIPLLAKFVPLWNLPVAILIVGYGLTWGILIFNFNNFLLYLVHTFWTH